MTLKQALDKGVLLLETENIADAKLDAWYLLSYVSGITRSDFILCQGNAIDGLTLHKYKEALLKRAHHIPLQHITGEQASASGAITMALP